MVVHGGGPPAIVGERVAVGELVDDGVHVGLGVRLFTGVGVWDEVEVRGIGDRVCCMRITGRVVSLGDMGIIGTGEAAIVEAISAMTITRRMRITVPIIHRIMF